MTKQMIFKHLEDGEIFDVHLDGKILTYLKVEPQPLDIMAFPSEQWTCTICGLGSVNAWNGTVAKHICENVEVFRWGRRK